MSQNDLVISPRSFASVVLRVGLMLTTFSVRPGSWDALSLVRQKQHMLNRVFVTRSRNSCPAISEILSASCPCSTAAIRKAASATSGKNSSARMWSSRMAVMRASARVLATAGGAIPVDITKLQLPRLLRFASVASFVHPWL